MTANPQPLDQSELEFLLGGGMATERDRNAGANLVATMRGDLQQISLSDIFQTLAMSKLTGLLTVSNPLEQRQLYCTDGCVQLLLAPRQANKALGQILLASRQVSVEELKRALLAQKKTGGTLAQALVAQGALGKEQVTDLFDQVASEELFALFTWRHGTFEFYKDAAHEALGHAECGQYEISSLLLEVARRSDEWDSIDAALQNLDEVPVATGTATSPPASATHQQLLELCDGRHSWRELAERAALPLFDAARAARDLVRSGALTNLDDDGLAAVAAHHAECGQKKRALMALQTLRDRPGERTAAVMETIGTILRTLGQARLAGQMLLEAAARQPDLDRAVELANLVLASQPRDVDSLAALHGIFTQAGDAAAAQSVALQWLDGLIAEAALDEAESLLQQLQAAGLCPSELLPRAARLHCKHKQPQQAAGLLLELAQWQIQHGKSSLARATLDDALRLDRTRKDIQKLQSQLRPGSGRWLRWVAMLVAGALFSAMGIVLYGFGPSPAQIASANAELDQLLQRGELPAAERLLAHWRDTGNGEWLDELERRYRFAVAAESHRQEQTNRQRFAQQLDAARSRLEDGALAEALVLYGSLAEQRETAQQTTSQLNQALSTLREQFAQAASSLLQGLPPVPTAMFSPGELQAQRARLRASYPRAVDQLWALLASEPPSPNTLVDAARWKSLCAQAAAGAQQFRAADELLDAYDQAIACAEQQVQLEPLLAQALAKEQARDFAAAGQLFTQLATHTSTRDALHAQYQAKATDLLGLAEQFAAIEQAIAQQQPEQARAGYLALAAQRPDLPIGTLVQLPVTLLTTPSGATVLRDEVAVGTTPCTLRCAPDQPTSVSLRLPGYQTETLTLAGGTTSQHSLVLSLLPDRRVALTAPCEVSPVADAAGAWYLCDRAGALTCYAADHALAWRFASADLSGWLTAPLLHQDFVVIGSLDGELRALRRSDGTVAHQVPNLPTEQDLQPFAGGVALCTTEQAVVVVQFDQPSSATTLARGCRSNLVVCHGDLLLLDAQGLSCVQSEAFAPRWQLAMPGTSKATLVATAAGLCITEETGMLSMVDSQGRLLWQIAGEPGSVGKPLPLADRILVATPTALRWLEAQTGASCAAWPCLEAAWQGALAATPTQIFAASEDGYVQVLDRASGQRLCRAPGHRRSLQLHVLAGQVLACTPDRELLVLPRLP